MELPGEARGLGALAAGRDRLLHRRVVLRILGIDWRTLLGTVNHRRSSWDIVSPSPYLSSFHRCAAWREPGPAARQAVKCDETRAMLVEIYNWFTEGFDTADLKDAKALLEELNS